MKNQLVAHPQVKLRVASRNTTIEERTELVTTLNTVASDLSEIARLIEESAQSSIPVISQSKLKAKA